MDLVAQNPALVIDLIIFSGLMVFPWGRKVLKWFLLGSLAVAAAILALLWICEPDLRD